MTADTSISKAVSTGDAYRIVLRGGGFVGMPSECIKVVAIDQAMSGGTAFPIWR